MDAWSNKVLDPSRTQAVQRKAHRPNQRFAQRQAKTTPKEATALVRRWIGKVPAFEG